MPTVSRYSLPPNDEKNTKPPAPGRMRSGAGGGGGRVRPPRTGGSAARDRAGSGRRDYLPRACLIKAKAAWMSWDF